MDVQFKLLALDYRVINGGSHYHSLYLGFSDSSVRKLTIFCQIFAGWSSNMVTSSSSSTDKSGQTGNIKLLTNRRHW
ncbi:hypothetical protein CJ030_MR4G000595 [Morella rubra]|uniref:Uncharacterized protein n=1 Tax=Morella rubra TaxID=262757 RepID=A0A6A1VTR3_9ROSI|nr:hypothetical protein CJ030_MR4G000595 [Morella rubra]